MEVDQAERFILDLMRSSLPESLYYHGLHHTLDVKDAAAILAKEEGITDLPSLNLLRTAALFHDSGFMKVYKDHEEKGCEIARTELPEFGYSNVEIELICGMIMATKIPQNPKNHLEQIICDADLDYLGRSDFEPVAKTLFHELKSRDLISDEAQWNLIQIQFLESHYYHTNSAKARRNDEKQKHLNHLREIVRHSD